MYKRPQLFFWSTGIILLLIACSKSNASNENTSTGTSTTGPVSIATDHSIYKPTDSIQVTVLNTLSKPVYALDTQASCSILGLEIDVNGAWQASSVARCPLGRPAMLVKLEPGKVYTATIQASSRGFENAVFPSGTYRLVLNYTASTNVKNIISSPTTVFSMPFSVTGLAPPSTPPSGTPIKPTPVTPPPTP